MPSSGDRQFGIVAHYGIRSPSAHSQWAEFNYEAFVDQEDYIVPVENKRDSFSVLNEEIVAVDYGS